MDIFHTCRKIEFEKMEEILSLVFKILYLLHYIRAILLTHIILLKVFLIIHDEYSHCDI